MKRSAILSLTLVALVAAACGSTAATTSTTVTTAAPITTTTAAMETALADIVGVAAEAGSFSTLLTAVEAAGLVDTLQSDGPFTVFAPTDEAFASLPEGTLEALLADTDALSGVLLYHVVSGEVLAADVIGLESATSVQGEDIAITVDGESV
jgi:transforming growth factor-beta-induced protein